MFEGPVLKTERLILRVPHVSDFDAFAAMNTDEDNKRFIGWGLDRSRAGQGLYDGSRRVDDTPGFVPHRY